MDFDIVKPDFENIEEDIIMKEYLAMWKQYVDFKGKTNLRGYWMAFLINVIVAAVLGLIAKATDFTILTNIYSLAVMIPGLAICVRRLNDAGKSWANIFWSFLPLVGQIILIVKLCAPSQNAVQNA